MVLKALAGVSLDIEPGERLGIIGPVGAGKSSLLGVLAGLILPDEGSVTHGDLRLSARVRPRSGSVGLAFQAPEKCLFGKNVLEDVAFAPRQAGVASEEAHRLAAAALLATGLSPEKFAPRSPFSLSMGEQRRVALAGVLASQPQALLLDEPTAHLDPLTRRDLTGRLLDLNQEQGTTMVIVSHDMDEILRLAERVVVIDGGRVAADGKAAAILTDVALLERHSLEPPGVVKLSLQISQAVGGTTPVALTEADVLATLMAALPPGGAP